MFTRIDTDLTGLKAELNQKEEAIMLKATSKVDKLRDSFEAACQKVLDKIQGRKKAYIMMRNAANDGIAEMESLEEKAKAELSKAYF